MINIPLDNGASNAHQTFTIQLGSNLTRFSLNYLQTGQWSVDISVNTVFLANGAMLEPNCDILQHLNITESFGRLVFTGVDTTLNNLGVDNKLTWVSPDEII
jgi:hypothetical protein